MKIIKTTLILGLAVSGAVFAQLSWKAGKEPEQKKYTALMQNINQVLKSEEELNRPIVYSPVDDIPSDPGIYKNTWQMRDDVAFARPIHEDAFPQSGLKPTRFGLPVDHESSADRKIKERSKQIKRDIAFAHAMNADLSIYHKAEQFKRDIAFASLIHEDARLHGGFRTHRLGPVDHESSADRKIKERSNQMGRDIAFARFIHEVAGSHGDFRTHRHHK